MNKKKRNLIKFQDPPAPPLLLALLLLAILPQVADAQSSYVY
jgi:hypothetical protein